MVAQKTSQARKMVGIHTGSRQMALIGLLVCLALVVLIGGIALITAASHRDIGIRQPAVTTASAALDAQHATYRYSNPPDGTMQVQRSIDGGRTWATGDIIPEPVLQLASNPVDDTVVFARTGANLWHSETGGASWARVASLPGRPLTLAMTGHSDPSGRIFLGTDTQGLFTSVDGARTWQAAGGRLSLVGAGSLAITAIAVSPDDAQVVYAAATFSMATPQGLHSMQIALISVDDGQRWFEMAPAPSPSLDRPITQLTPFSQAVGPLLAVLIPSSFGTQVVALAVDPDFATGLDDPDPGMRAATARALGFSHNRSLLPVLLLHLGDPDLLASDQVAQAIGRLGDAAAVPMPLLMPALSATDEAIRAQAATAAGMLHAEEAIPQLSTMLRHDAPWASRNAAEALATIGTPAAMAALTAPLADPQMTPARQIAMSVLETAGPPAVAAVMAALNDSSAVVRANAAEMLGWLSPVENPLQKADAVADLERLLSDPAPAVRVQAAWALGQMDSGSARLAAVTVRPVAPALLAALPGALANYWTRAAMATLLLLALLAIVLLGKGSRPTSHLGHA